MTDATAATRSDSDMTRTPGGVAAICALAFFIVVVATVTFVLSFHGLDDYGRRVAALGDLSPLVPLGIDGLTLVAVAATVILRHAALHVRAYAWFVFTVAVSLSVLGNLSHAISRHLSPEGMAGAAAWPILLALASHLVIVTLRAVERVRHSAPVAAPVVAVPIVTPMAVTPAAAPAVAAPPTEVLPDAPVAPRPAAPAERRVTARPASRQTRSGGSVRDTARRLWTEGKSHPEIALMLGISKKTAERHTEQLRQAASPTDADQERELVAAMA